MRASTKCLCIGLTIFCLGYLLDATSTYLNFVYFYDTSLISELNCHATDMVMDRGPIALFEFEADMMLSYGVLVFAGAFFTYAMFFRFGNDEFKKFYDNDDILVFCIAIGLSTIGGMKLFAAVSNTIVLLVKFLGVLI